MCWLKVWGVWGVRHHTRMGLDEGQQPQAMHDVDPLRGSAHHSAQPLCHAGLRPTRHRVFFTSRPTALPSSPSWVLLRHRGTY